ncbi:hypothetical protein FNF28_02606 [Cafeteria roenbergensis]|uniref:Uncharacterized protein n=1 Tax=Cafeteria roenbergensis TaxID=33653 RepID=A0A5A8DSC9_CAFRO|nr:hypothetical protein FNF28_02606 [Cafeteria roenbergensis]
MGGFLSKRAPAKGAGVEGELAHVYGTAGGEDLIGSFWDASDSARPSVILVTVKHVELYHPDSGDRRMRVELPGEACSASLAPTSCFGAVLVVGLKLGTTVVFDAVTLKRVKMVRTDGATGTAPGRPVTCAKVLLHGRFFAGHQDGSVRGYALESKAPVAVTFMPPDQEDDELAGSPVALSTAAGSKRLRDSMGPVVGLTTIADGDRPVLAVGHENGIIHIYVAADGKWLGCYKASGPIAGLFSLPQFSCIAAPVKNSKVFHLFDLLGERSVQLNLEAELASIKRPFAELVCADFDSDRALLLSAHSDGSIFAREVNRVPGTKDITLRLKRFLAPRAGAPVNRPIMLWYSSSSDTALVCEVGGEAKVLRGLTGTPFDKIDKSKVGAGAASGASSEAAAAEAEFNVATRERAAAAGREEAAAAAAKKAEEEAAAAAAKKAEEEAAAAAAKKAEEEAAAAAAKKAEEEAAAAAAKKAEEEAAAAAAKKAEEEAAAAAAKKAEEEAAAAAAKKAEEEAAAAKKAEEEAAAAAAKQAEEEAAAAAAKKAEEEAAAAKKAEEEAAAAKKAEEEAAAAKKAEEEAAAAKKAEEEAAAAKKAEEEAAAAKKAEEEAAAAKKAEAEGSGDGDDDADGGDDGDDDGDDDAGDGDDAGDDADAGDASKKADDEKPKPKKSSGKRGKKRGKKSR